jgi:putative ABC transport system permease protein
MRGVRLRRGWGYTLLNVSGLALGISVCLVIALFVFDELGADRFHEHYDRTFQVGFDLPDRSTLAGPYPLAAALEAGDPRVERAVSMHRRANLPAATGSGNVVADFDVLYAEAALFDVFSYPVLAGDPVAALAAPDGLVLTATAARELFGGEDPLGQPVVLGGVGRELWRSPDPAVEVTVGAVIADPPARSSLQFDVLAPVELIPGFATLQQAWDARAFETAVVVAPGYALRDLEAAVSATLSRHVAHLEDVQPFVVDFPSVYFSELHTADGFRGQRRYLIGFSAAALFILLIAALNYINLATAQGLRRAREVGVRKAIGATRGQVAFRFLRESLLLSSVALGLGLTLAHFSLPIFNRIAGTELSLLGHPLLLAGVAAAVLCAGLLSGTYPALVLSAFDPVVVLRDGLPRLGRVAFLRRGLVAVQFAASSLLLVCAFIVHAQLAFVQSADRGFDDQNTVVFELPAQRLAGAGETVKREVEQLAGVGQASITTATPGWHRQRFQGPRRAISPQTHGDPDEPLWLAVFAVDSDFPSVLGLRTVAGRQFGELEAGERAGAVLINETAVRAMGWSIEESIGRPFAGDGLALLGAAPHATVVGVVRDFHVTSAREEIPATVLRHVQRHGTTGALQVAVRLTDDADGEAVARIGDVLAPFHPGGLVEASFVADRFRSMYESEARLAQVVTLFMVLAVSVSLMGLFGLIALAIEQRRRELAIRKVLGATVISLLLLLSEDYLKSVSIGFLLAAPIGYVIMSGWLEGFAYQVRLGPSIFLAVAVVLALLTLATAGMHAVRTAHINVSADLRTN